MNGDNNHMIMTGLHVVRRLASYLTKITAAQLQYATEALKVSVFCCRKPAPLERN